MHFKKCHFFKCRVKCFPTSWRHYDIIMTSEFFLTRPTPPTNRLSSRCVVQKDSIYYGSLKVGCPNWVIYGRTHLSIYHVSCIYGIPLTHIDVYIGWASVRVFFVFLFATSGACQHPDIHTESRVFSSCYCTKSKATMNLKFYRPCRAMLKNTQSKFQLNPTMLSYLFTPAKNAIFANSFIFYIVAHGKWGDCAAYAVAVHTFSPLTLASAWLCDNLHVTIFMVIAKGIANCAGRCMDIY